MSHFLRALSRTLPALAAVLLAGLLVSPAAAQRGPEEGQIVRAIEFNTEDKSERTVSDAYLLRQLKLTVGQKYSRDKLNEDFKRLTQLGFFSNISVTTEQLTDGVKLVYTLTENLVIGEITLVGFDNLPTADVLPQLRLKSGRPYSEYLGRLDKEQIERMYRQKGYQFAHVRRLKRENPPKVDVRFRVDEGPLVTLDSIGFAGNSAFTAKELKKQMQLSESSKWIWFLTETFDPDLLQQDIVTLRRFYRGKGFLDADVALADVNYAPDKSSMSVEIAVEERARYKVDQIAFEGNALFTDTELANRIGLAPGVFYDEEKLFAGRRKIERLYADNARIYAQISIKQVYPEEGALVSLIVQIREGPRVKVERVEIKGNEQTKDDVIRRELLLSPGDPFNLTKLRRTHRRLLSLDYFSNINFDIREAESGDKKFRDLIVEVTEKRTGAVRFAVGVTSNAGLVGELSLTERNFDITRWPKSWSDLVGGNAFKGAGQYFQIAIEPGSELNRFSLIFNEPSVKGGPYSFGFRLGGFTRGRETYDESRANLTLSTGRRFWRDRLSTRLSLNLERVDIDADGDAPEDVEEFDGSNNIISLTAGVDYDRRNDPILPSAGYRLGASIQPAGGDFTFVKTNFRGAYYYTTHRKKDGRPYILTLRGRVGLGGGDIPIFARYFAGGSGSVRGYEFRSVSPRQGEADQVVGGDYLTVINIEYSIPLVEEYLRMVTFLDVGGAGGETRAGLGAGFRLRMPIFGPVPLALDFAIPLNEKDGDETEVFSFSLGRSF